MMTDYAALVVKCAVGMAITVVITAGIWYVGTTVLEVLFDDEME